MKRLIFSVVLFSLVFTGNGYGQGSKPVKSISLDQLLGKKTEKVVQSAQQGYREHIGAIGSVLERIELKGNSLTQDKISTPYRRYVVNGTMDLGGKTISMPDGCILDLENGSLKNGSLKMNTTLVTPIYGISKERNINKVKVSGEYYETLVDLWGEQTEPLFPWDTTAPKKVYLVDLKKFGITPGYQKRGSDNHYTDKQYDLMYNNGVGFTNAIRWAYDNGYDGIRFPKNDYCFTPRTTKNEKPTTGPIVLVQDLDKFDIDFGGGSYYLILDSKKKSQHFAVSPEKPYAQGGTMFFVACCINLQLHNGRFVGDRKLRDYDDGAERNLENSRAFALSSYCQNIRLHHLDLSEFMADGISIGQTGNFYDEYDGVLRGPIYSEMGKLTVLKDDLFSTLSSYMRTDFLYRGADAHPVMQKIAAKRYFTINNNRGYTRIPNVYSNIEVYTYNAKISKDKPLRRFNSSYLEHFELLPDETGVRYRSLHDDGVNDGNFKHSAAVSDIISSNVIIEYCSIHDNHRGGISGGSNNNTVRFCSFSKSSKDSNSAGKTIPIFIVGGTNYHINYEDSFAKNLVVHDCTFTRDNSSIGKLLFGVFTLSFFNNKSDSGVRIYNNILSDIHHNSFGESGLAFSSWAVPTDDISTMKSGLRYMSRVVLFHDNSETSSSKPTLNHRTVLISFNNY